MEAPPTVLPKCAASTTSARTGTHFVTGDTSSTSAPAAAPLDAFSSSSPPAPVSEADLQVAALSTETSAAPSAEVLSISRTDATKQTTAPEDDSEQKRPAESEQKRPAESEQKRPAESEQKRPAESEQKRPAESEQKRPAESEQKRPAESEQKRPAESEQKRPAESEQKRPAESEQKRPAESEQKRPAESEQKRPAESEQKRPAESEQKRPAESEQKRPAESEQKRPAESEQKRPAESEQKRPAESEQKRPAESEQKRPAESEQKRPAESEQKRPAESEQKRPAESEQKRPAESEQKRPAESEQKRPAEPEQKRPAEQKRPGAPNPLNRPQTYREFCEETSRTLAAYYRSLEDSDTEEQPSPPRAPRSEAVSSTPLNVSEDATPPPALAEDLPGPSGIVAFAGEASEQSPSTSRAPERHTAFRISRSRSSEPPGGLSGLLFTDAVHRMLKHLAHTQMHVGIEWMTLLQIFTENRGNGASRFHDVHNITIIKDYAIVCPDRQPDIWFSLRDYRSIRALTYFVRLSTRYAWWTCRFVDVLQTPTPSAATAIGRILRRLRPTLHGITFPQSPDFWFGRNTHEIRSCFTWLPIDPAAHQYVRGVDCYANHLMKPEYWTQSHLVRMSTEGCSSCSYMYPDANQYLTVFSFYRDLRPRLDAMPQAQYLAEATADDYALQASISWPSNFFHFWENFGTHFTILHVRLFSRCHPVSPRAFMLQLITRVRDWPRLHHIQVDLLHPGETRPEDSVSVPNQATEFAVETLVRCQVIRDALREEQPPRHSEFSITADLDCWHASPEELQQVVAAVRRFFEISQQQMTLETPSDNAYVLNAEWNGHNYHLVLRIPIRALNVGRTIRRPPPLDEAERVRILRERLETVRKKSAADA
ncbi:hypothetical protein AAVH_09121 [Aphelenchoides avenae]|nr:hypothetical protein AAVH_09121 [Aphelenchus avenae]